jgi:2-methylisocitrate lyase-like PEP mutase family enzyme
MRKTSAFRERFRHPGVIRIVGAHDGLGAKLIEESGFDGVWASGLEISASYGVPDANILTMTQYLERACEMNDACALPVVADCDTGYGNSNNAMHMVRKYEAAGIAAVCIEDKQFPKVISYVARTGTKMGRSGYAHRPGRSPRALQLARRGSAAGGRSKNLLPRRFPRRAAFAH